MSTLTHIVNHYKKYILENYPPSTEYIYDVGIATYFVENYLTTYHTSFIFTESLKIPKKVHNAVIEYIDNVMNYLVYNYDYLQSLFIEGYNASMYEYLNGNYAIPLAEEDYIDIVLSVEYLTYVGSVFKMNPITCFLQDNDKDFEPIIYSPLSIFMSYIQEYVSENQSTHITIDVNEFEKVYLEDIQFYRDNWLTNHIVYDKKRFIKEVVQNVELIKEMYDLYNSLMLDEEWYNSHEHETAQSYLSERLDAELRTRSIATKSKLTNTDLVNVSQQVDNFLRNTDLGLVTPDELIKEFAAKYHTFEPVFMFSEIKEREEHILSLFENFLDTTVQELQTLSEYGVLEGNVNENGIVSFPKTPTIKQLEMGLCEYEKENKIIINLFPLRNNLADREIYQILNNEQNSPIQIKKLSQLIIKYANENTIRLEDVLSEVDIEAIYTDYFSTVGFVPHTFKDFMHYITDNKQEIIVSYRDNFLSGNSFSKEYSANNQQEYSVDTFIEFILKYYDDMHTTDIDYSKNPQYQFSLEEVYAWNTSFGVTVDREKMTRYLSTNAEIKREVKDIFIDAEDDETVIAELTELFDSYIQKFTTNKRYTVKDRAYILDAIRKSDRVMYKGQYAELQEHDKDYTVNEAQELTNIMSRKETLALKKSRNYLEEYQQLLSEYINEYFAATIENKKYFSLEESDRKLVEESFVTNEENIAEFQDDFEKWMYFNLQYFYAIRKQNMVTYQKDKVEKAIDITKMREIYTQLLTNDKLSTTQKMEVTVRYLEEIAHPYQLQLTLTDEDWETIDILFTVGISKLAPYKRLAASRYTKESLLKYFSVQTLTKLKAESKTQQIFEYNLRKMVASYVNSKGKELEKNRKVTSVPLNMEEFPFDEKIKSLEEYVVRYVEQGTQQNIYVISRNHEIITNYSELTGEYIINGYKNIDEYEKKNNIQLTGNKATVLDLKTGKFITVDFDNLIEFDRSKRVHGWMEFPIDSDGWYRIAFMNVSPKRFYNKESKLAKTKLKNSIRNRILHEANRKRDILLLRNQQQADKELDEYIKEKEKKEEEERLIRNEKEKIDNHLNEEKLVEAIAQQEDTTGQLLEQNLKETLTAIEEVVGEKEYKLTDYRKKLFKELLSNIATWKQDSTQLPLTQQIKGVVVDKENYRIKLNIGQNIFIVSPYYFINGSYCTIYADVGKKIYLPNKIDESDLIEPHKKYIKELVNKINEIEKLTAKTIIKNSTNDIQRLLRIKKVLKASAMTINNEEFNIKDNIDGGMYSHLEIKVKVNLVNKETGKVTRSIFTFIYAPSVVFLQEKNMYIYRRSGNDGINLNELHSLWSEQYLGGAMNKKKLFYLLNTQDLRRKV